VGADCVIVVVDDERDLRDFVCHLLEDEGYPVCCMSHPVELTRLSEAEYHPQLFLIDIMLPEMNGIALAGRLRNEGFEHTPKIAMSASHDMIRLAQESKLFDATLDKPFDIDQLLDCIEQHLAG
jgi:CheY-like chemotaxis protein